MRVIHPRPEVVFTSSYPALKSWLPMKRSGLYQPSVALVAHGRQCSTMFPAPVFVPHVLQLTNGTQDCPATGELLGFASADSGPVPRTFCVTCERQREACKVNTRAFPWTHCHSPLVVCCGFQLFCLVSYPWSGVMGSSLTSR